MSDLARIKWACIHTYSRPSPRTCKDEVRVIDDVGAEEAGTEGRVDGGAHGAGPEEELHEAPDDEDPQARQKQRAHHAAHAQHRQRIQAELWDGALKSCSTARCSPASNQTFCMGKSFSCNPEIIRLNPSPLLASHH